MEEKQVDALNHHDNRHLTLKKEPFNGSFSFFFLAEIQLFSGALLFNVQSDLFYSGNGKQFQC